MSINDCCRFYSKAASPLPLLCPLCRDTARLDASPAHVSMRLCSARCVSFHRSACRTAFRFRSRLHPKFAPGLNPKLPPSSLTFQFLIFISGPVS
ncbi:hypothetical protein EVAR_23143_1 [Eumeta japonica]|uniref:Uncharacterized protein n=1 Tax=Eumeta variegata TaxID=151549 RepID=A0A4C1VD71_EUMVA|nr:hypothetical protein EVAR_23143_1 [Eumeta japonica]